MKTSFRRNINGFTLIELLVVVLIIGILSSVALPQYTMAVEKARATEAIQNAAMLEKQIDLYILENGVTSGGSGSFGYDDFATVEIGGLYSDNGGYRTKFFRYYPLISKTSASGLGNVEISRISSEGTLYSLLSTTGPSDFNSTVKTGGWYRACVTQSTEFGRKICKQLDSLGWKYADADL